MHLRAALLLCAAALARAAGGPCEPVRVAMCRSMPWNMTRMPNHLHHSTQENAVLAAEQYEELVASGCSAALRFFLCATYAPICALEFLHDPIRPCRAVCERARDGCEPLMRRYNHSWPESLACEDLPEYEHGVCISPEAIVTDVADDPELVDFSRHLVLGDTEALDCGPLRTDGCVCTGAKPTFRAYVEKKFDYVIHARTVSVSRVGCEEIISVVEVKQVLKGPSVLAQSHTPLVTNSSCPCPQLQPHQEVIIMCYQRASRLMLLDGCLVEQWRHQLAARHERWEQQMHQRQRKGLKRDAKASATSRKNGKARNL